MMDMNVNKNARWPVHIEDTQDVTEISNDEIRDRAPDKKAPMRINPSNAGYDAFMTFVLR